MVKRTISCLLAVTFALVNSITPFHSIMAVAEQKQIPQIFTSDFRGAYVDSNGDLYTWGDNYYGNLGYSTPDPMEDYYTHYGNYPNPTPKKVMGNVAKVFMDDDHSAAITNNGELYTWGYNYDGELGNGSYSHSDPVVTPIKILDNVRDVKIVEGHGAAITTSDELYTWGQNGLGQLGNGTYEDSYRPIKVMDDVRSVYLGWTSCAVVTNNNDLYVWGNKVTDAEYTYEHAYSVNYPVHIMSDVKEFYLDYPSYDERYVLKNNGELFSYGFGNYDSLNKVADNVKDFRSGHFWIGNNSYSSGAYIDYNNNLYSLNYNNDNTLLMTNIRWFDLQGDTGIAINDNNELFMWGENESGQCGTGDLNYVESPTKILNNVQSASICVVFGRLNFSAAITTDGHVYSWGNNIDGQLGDGSFESKYSPTLVSVINDCTDNPSNFIYELSFSDVNCVTGNNEWFFGNYTTQFPQRIDNELDSIKVSYDESVMEINDVSYSKSGKNGAIISGTINAKKAGHHEVTVSLANSDIDAQTFLVNIEPELVLPGSSEGNFYNHYACMTVNCDGAEDVVTKDVTFNVSIDEANAEYLESFLNSIEVSTLETGDLTAHATYKTSYTIADDGKSAEFVVTVSCVNTDMTDYISVKTSAQEKVLQVTRNTNYHDATHYRNFVIGRDSNSFLHTNNSEYKDAGFVGRTDHVFSSAEYYDELTKNSSFGEKIEIIKRMNEEWKGSCYGIALSIGLVNQNHIPIADITNTNASKYYDLNPTMSKDNKFSNMIEYYYLSQYLDKGGKSAVECQNFKNSNGLRDLVYGYSDLSTTLKHIVNKAYDQKPFILCFGYGKDSGHAVVALGCERVEGAYNIIVYDENSIDHINYKYFTINDDYSGFNCSGDNFNSSNYRYLQVVDMEAMKNTSVLSPEIKNIDNYKIAPVNDDNATILASSTKMLMSSGTMMSDSEMKNDNVNISFYGDASFRLINSNGETLTYKDGVFSGEIKVLSISSYLCNDKPFYTITINPEDEYIIERNGSKLDIEISDNNHYYAIQSDKMERLTVNFNNGLSLNGSNFDFTAQVGVNNNSPTLLSVSGTSEKDLIVDTTEKDVVFSSEGTFDNVVVTSYVDVEKFENEYGAINSDFKVDSSDATITKSEDTTTDNSSNTDSSNPNDDSSSNSSSETDNSSSNDSSTSDNNSSSDTSSTSSDSSNSSSSSISDSSSSNTPSNNNSGSNTSQSNNPTNSVIKNTGDTSNPNTGDVGTATKAFGLAALMLGITTVLKKKKQ